MTTHDTFTTAIALAQSRGNLWSRANPSARTRVLFVCLGNICRSPLAKAIFTDHARARGVLERFRIDSCGTGNWHAGNLADARSIAVSIRRGASLSSTSHRARQFDSMRDPETFDLFLAMDQSNKANMIDMGAPASQVILIRSFDPSLAHHANANEDHQLEVPDPYQGGPEGFDQMHDMLLAACDGLLDRFESAWK